MSFNHSIHAMDDFTLIDLPETKTRHPSFKWTLAIAAFLLVNGPVKYGARYLLRYLTQRIKAWGFLLRGVHIIQRKFEKAKGKPFEIFAPDGRYILVSSPEDIREIEAIPETVLSKRAAVQHALQSQYTMHGFDSSHAQGSGSLKGLRSMFIDRLPRLLPGLGELVGDRFRKMLESHPVVRGRTLSPAYHTILNLVVLSNTVVLFGPELAEDERFLKFARRFIEQTLISAEILRLLPASIKSFVGPFLVNHLRAQSVLVETLLPIVQQRLEEKEAAKLEQDVPKHDDLIQWLIDSSSNPNPDQIIHEILTIVFLSIHTMATTLTFALHDLFLHPSSLSQIRNDPSTSLLESFIKESARLTPLDSLSNRRQALHSFTLSSGTHVKPGDWLCTPAAAMMRSEENYHNAEKFDGFRFANISNPGPVRPPLKRSNSANPDDEWHFLGSGRPGRKFAMSIMTMILGQIVKDYDFELAHPKVPRSFTWRSSTLPNWATKVVFTARKE